MSFKIVAATPGSVGSSGVKDIRTVVQSMFFNWEPDNPEGQNLEELPVQVADCSKGTPKDLGIKFENCISVQLNYKGDVESFRGKTKGETLVTLGGRRQGRSGYGSITVPLGQIPAFCEDALRVHSAITEGLETVGDDADAVDEAASLTG